MIPLRRVLRLDSLGDVRPVREALVSGGFAAGPLDGLPAVITGRLDDAGVDRLSALVAAGQVRAASIIPLWEDIAVPPLASLTTVPAELAGAPAPA